MTYRRSPHRKILLALAAFVLLGALLLLERAPLLAQDRHFIWRVDSGEGHVTLMGSIHTLRREAYPLPPAFGQAYADAEGLVFETDMEQMNDPATQARLLALGLYPEGESLRDHVAPDAYEALAGALSERGFPREQFARFKPWFCAFTLTVLELQRLGYSPRHGLDMHYFSKARQDGKALYHLEPVEDQIRLLASLEQEAQEDFLLQSLQELEVLDAKASQMTEAWRNGDAEGLHGIIRMSFQGFPELHDRFMTERNRNWLPSIEALIRDEKKVLVVVGAGHLVGEEGLVRMLEDRGYRIEQQ